MKLIFLGDISLNNQYETTSVSPFDKISPILKDADYVIGNLECLARGSTYNKEKFPRLETSTEALEKLKLGYVSLVTLAHNHYWDNCDEGLQKSINKLNSLHIEHIGADFGSSKHIKILEHDNISVALLNYMHPDTNPKASNCKNVQVSLYNRCKIGREISELHTKVNHIVVLLHWGGRTERYHMPDLYEVTDARFFIECGASLVVGGHSHTIQPYEKHNGKYIFYSLGNCCFGDVICEGKCFPILPSGKEALVLSVEFSRDIFSVKLHTYRNRNFILEPAPDLMKRIIALNRLKKIVCFSPITWHCYNYALRTKKLVAKPRILISRIKKLWK